MRNVLVTGGSRGLGLAIASRLAGDGFRVVAVARSETPELRLAAQDAADARLVFRSCDLADTASLGAFVERLRKEFGPIYGLVNNAGIGTSGILSMMREVQIDSMVRLNTVSPIILTKHALRSMMVQREGRIINVASIVASTGYSGLSVYSATKASLLGFTRSLAREVGQLGITVNAVAPGFVDTAMTGELQDKERAQIMRRSALRRMVEPGDVADAVAFLMGEQARNLTGITLTIDAGNTA